MQVKSVECSAEQRRLANFIKSVHRQLRQKVIASKRALISVGRYRGTTVEPRYFFFHGISTVEVTVLPWYRNTTNTAVLPYGTVLANK